MQIRDGRFYESIGWHDMACKCVLIDYDITPTTTTSPPPPPAVRTVASACMPCPQPHAINQFQNLKILPSYYSLSHCIYLSVSIYAAVHTTDTKQLA